MGQEEKVRDRVSKSSKGLLWSEEEPSRVAIRFTLWHEPIATCHNPNAASPPNFPVLSGNEQGNDRDELKRGRMEVVRKGNEAATATATAAARHTQKCG